MTNRTVNNCPVCGNPLTISRLSCSGCGTSIEGAFGHGLFSTLSDEEIEFVELFVVCRGNIKEVEKRLGISYPTVRGKLDGIVAKLERTRHRGDDESRKKRRLEILDAIKRGDISAEQGAILLEEL